MVSIGELMHPYLKECELAAYGAKTQIEPIARLNLNEFQYDLSPNVVRVLREQAPLGKTYVYLGDKPTTELREKISDYVGVDAENIAIDEALDQVLNRLPRIFISPGDNMVTMSPTYPELGLGTKRAGGREKKVMLEEPDLAMDADKILEAIDNKTKLVFLCSPNNPTSLKIRRDDILKVVENANAVVVVDECYYEYCGETVADVVNEYENLYIMRSFSKGFGLAGTRMAYIISSREGCDAYNRILSGFEFNRFGVFGAMASLDDLDYYRGIWKKVAAEKDRIRTQYEKLGIRVWDSSTSFLFMDISVTGLTSTEVRDFFLEKYRILIRDVPATFPELDKKYISFGVAKPDINNLLISGMKEVTQL